MKHLLQDILARSEPTRSVLNTCIALLQRQVHQDPRPPQTHEELLLRARNSALDTAQALEEAMERARQASIDHAELLKRTDKLIQDLNRQASRYDRHSAGMEVAVDQLKHMLHEHETDRTLRALRQQ